MKTDLKQFMALLIVCFICNSCFAQDESLPVLEVLDEAPEIKDDTEEMVAEILDEAFGQRDGYDLPEDVVEAIKIRTMRFGELKIRFDKLKSQSELIRNQMMFINQAITSETYIFLASEGVPRDDMGNWKLDGDKVKRTK